jgi:hypothetical protein
MHRLNACGTAFCSALLLLLIWGTELTGLTSADHDQ